MKYIRESVLVWLWTHLSLQVKIYADVVINHMCMSDAGEGEGRRRSTCGSYFNASKREFPSVPFSASHFNDDKCTTSSRNIETYQDIYQVLFQRENKKDNSL